MAEDHRAPRADVVDVAAAVVAEYVRAAGALDEHRLAADGAERAHRGIHAAGNVAAGIGEQGHCESSVVGGELSRAAVSMQPYHIPRLPYNRLPRPAFVPS